VRRPHAQLLWLSILETVSFLALLTAMFAGSEGGVSVIGLVHGLLFLAYALVVFLGREALGWSQGFTALAILTGPVGAVLALERLRRDRLAARVGT
jgi:integral membrane protein